MGKVERNAKKKFKKRNNTNKIHDGRLEENQEVFLRKLSRCFHMDENNYPKGIERRKTMKFPNQEYKMVYRAGTFIDKHTLRREHESAWIVAWAFGLALMVCLFAVVFQSCAMGDIR